MALPITWKMWVGSAASSSGRNSIVGGVVGAASSATRVV